MKFNHGNGSCDACGHQFAPREKSVVVAPFVFCNRAACHRQGLELSSTHKAKKGEQE